MKYVGDVLPISRYYRKKLSIEVPEELQLKTHYGLFKMKYPYISFSEYKDILKSHLQYCNDKQKSLRNEKI